MVEFTQEVVKVVRFTFEVPQELFVQVVYKCLQVIIQNVGRRLTRQNNTENHAI